MYLLEQDIHSLTYLLTYLLRALSSFQGILAEMDGLDKSTKVQRDKGTMGKWDNGTMGPRDIRTMYVVYSVKCIMYNV